MADGGDGRDTIEGSQSDDTMEGGGGDDRLDGGAGTDTASYAYASVDSHLEVDLAKTGAQAVLKHERDTLISIENITGRDDLSGDNLKGNDDGNVLTGLVGDDVLRGRDGGDTLVGDQFDRSQVYDYYDNDTLIGAFGNDILAGGGGADLLRGGAGSDTFFYRSIADSLKFSFLDNIDTIADLTDSDAIDLSAIDADVSTAADDAFVLVDHPTTAAGTMYWVRDGADSRLYLNDGSTVLPPLEVPETYILARGDHTDFTNFIF